SDLEAQAISLANNLPSLIGSITALLGDELIPPIENPEIEGIQLELVGPGTTILEENGEPAALGVFARLDFSAQDVGGLRTQLEPVIRHTVIDIQDPTDLRAMLARKRNENQSFSYHDIMPHIEAHMDVTGSTADSHNIDY